MRQPPMLRAIAMPRHRLAAAEHRRHLVHFAKRPAAAAIVQFDQRAGPDRGAIVGKTSAGILELWRRIDPHSRRPRLDFIMFERAARQDPHFAQPLSFAAYCRAWTV